MLISQAHANAQAFTDLFETLTSQNFSGFKAVSNNEQTLFILCLYYLLLHIFLVCFRLQI